MYCRKIKPRYNFSPWEMHHFYSGAILAIGGFICLFYFPIHIGGLLFFFGGWLAVDDLVQHYIQKTEIKQYGFYTTVTFWHWFPYWCVGKDEL